MNLNIDERKNPQNNTIENYLKYTETTKKEQNSFIKALLAMFIIFICTIVGIFLFADNKEFLEDEFGENSFLTKLFLNLTSHTVLYCFFCTSVIELLKIKKQGCLYGI